MFGRSFNPDNIASASQDTAITDTTAHELLAAPGAGYKWMITHVSAVSLTTGSPLISFLSGSTQKIIMRASASTFGFSGGFDFKVPLPCDENEAVNMQSDTAGSVKTSIIAIKVPV